MLGFHQYVRPLLWSLLGDKEGWDILFLCRLFIFPPLTCFSVRRYFQSRVGCGVESHDVVLKRVSLHVHTTRMR